MHREHFPIPRTFQETVTGVHGEKGLQWLSRLSELLVHCIERWALELEKPFPGLSFNLVFPGKTNGGREIVMKLGVPCRELLTEIAALEVFAGKGSVRLLSFDRAKGVLLLERVGPGHSLKTIAHDAEATEIAAKTMKHLFRPTPLAHPFPSLEDWHQAFSRLRMKFNQGTGPFSPELIETAEKLFGELHSESISKVLLHGDLHHGNLLFSQTHGWVSIDPKGVVGEPGYEVGAFMRNRISLSDSEQEISTILNTRLDIFSDVLGIDLNRLAMWTVYHAVLSALWSWEDSMNYSEGIRLAEVMRRTFRI